MSTTTTTASPPSGKRNNTVSVCCKLPNGFIMQLQDFRMEQPPQGGKDVKIHFRVGKQFEISGANHAHKAANPKTEEDKSRHGVFGFGITDVDADLWEAWLKQNAGWPPLTTGMVFAQPTQEKAVDEAKEKKKMKTGFDRLDQDKPGPGLEKVKD